MEYRRIDQAKRPIPVEDGQLGRAGLYLESAAVRHRECQERDSRILHFPKKLAIQLKWVSEGVISQQ
jgi:hypothetical protein